MGMLSVLQRLGEIRFSSFFNNSVKLENEQISIISVLKTLRTSPVAVANV